MKKKLLVFFVLCFSLSAAQEAGFNDLIKMGIKYHDRGDYEEAVKYYDMALMQDPDNALALLEKSFSLNEAGSYGKALEACQKVIDARKPARYHLEMAYLYCGTSYDGLRNEKKSIEMYNKAAKINPANHSTFFNKGITYLNYSNKTEAEKAFKQALILSPAHPSSLYRLAYLAYGNGEKIPAILGFCKFLVVESTSKRSIGAAETLLMLLNSGVKKSQDGMNLTVVSPGKGHEDFTVVDAALVMSNSVQTSGEKLPNLTGIPSEYDLLITQLKIVSTALKIDKDGRKDFYRPHFTSYLSKMGETELKVLAHIILAANNNENSVRWIRLQQEQVDAFYEFSNKNF